MHASCSLPRTRRDQTRRLRAGAGRTARGSIEPLEPRCLLSCQGLPFVEDFENFDLAAAPNWEFSAPSSVQLSSEHEPRGASHLLLAGNSNPADAVANVSIPASPAELELSFFGQAINGTDSNLLTIQASGDRSNWHTIAVIEPHLGGYLYFTFDLKAELDQANISLNEFFLRFRHTGDGESNHRFALDNLQITDQSTLIDTSLANARLSEGESTMMTVTRFVDLETELVLTLTNDHPEQLIVPRTVTIGRDLASATFPVRAANDGNLDGAQLGVFSMTAPGVNLIRCSVMTLDDDTAQVQTVGGPLQGRIESSTYEVVSTLEVLPDTTLTIAADTTLEFASDTGVNVRGALLGRGTAEAPVVLTSLTQEPGAWRGVSIAAANAPPTIVDYFTIEYATTGIRIDPMVSGPAVTVSNTAILHSAIHGIVVSAGADRFIRAGEVNLLKNKVYQNQGTGILISANAIGCDSSSNSAHVIGNEIHDNGGHGLMLSASGSSNRQCILPGPRSSSVTGLVADNWLHANARDGIYSSATRHRWGNYGRIEVTFTNNLVASNGEDGFDFFASEAVSRQTLYNNTVVNNQGAGITHDRQATMHNNIVHGNLIGVEAPQNVEFDQVSHNLVMHNLNGDWLNFPATFGVPKHDPDSRWLFDAHQNLLESPRFVGGGDFHLRHDSPAIDAALKLHDTPNRDGDGQTRSDLPDIGYDEFVDRVRNEWAHDAFIRETRDDSIISIAAGPVGALYAAGTRKFIGDEHRFTGDASTFIQRYARDGQRDWQVDISGFGDVRAKKVGVDAAGNVYVVGVFSDTVDFDSRVIHQNQRDVLHSHGGYDVFVLKLNHLGQFQWVTQFGSDSETSEQVNSLHVTPAGDVTLGGRFSGAVDFDPHPTFGEVASSNGNSDAFVVSLTSEADYLWSWSGGGSGVDAVSALAVDSSNVAHVAMIFEHTVDIDGDGSVDVTSEGDFDVALFTINPAGVARGPFEVIAGEAEQTVEAYVLDENGNRYLGGRFAGTTDFDPTAAQSHRRQSLNGSFDGFFLSLTPSSEIRWIEQVGGPGDDRAVDIDLRTNGDLLLTGQFVDVISSAASARLPFDAIGSGQDAFLLSVSQSGIYQTLHTYGGLGDDQALAAAVLPDGRVAFAGHFSDTIEFSTETASIRLESQGRKDAFVAHLTAEHDSIPGDLDGNRVANAADIDLFFSVIKNGSHDRRFDLTLDDKLDAFDVNQLIVNVVRTTFGDANLDGVFDSSDLVQVFKAGEYEDGVAGNSGWAEGDWNGDGDFGSSDLVLALRDGQFAAASRRPVPEGIDS